MSGARVPDADDLAKRQQAYFEKQLAAQREREAAKQKPPSNMTEVDGGSRAKKNAFASSQKFKKNASASSQKSAHKEGSFTLICQRFRNCIVILIVSYNNSYNCII